MASDTLHKNHFVAKNADDYLLESEDLYKVQFSKLVRVKNKEGKTVNKYVRATVNAGNIQFKEIVDKYGLKLSDRWEIWDTEAKQNVPFDQTI